MFSPYFELLICERLTHAIWQLQSKHQKRAACGPFPGRISAWCSSCWRNGAFGFLLMLIAIILFSLIIKIIAEIENM